MILNLPLVGVFVSVLRLPHHVLATLVLLPCLVGAYSLNNSQLDLGVLVGFGAFGYVLRKLAIDPSPLVVALDLGLAAVTAPAVMRCLRRRPVGEPPWQGDD